MSIQPTKPPSTKVPFYNPCTPKDGYFRCWINRFLAGQEIEQNNAELYCKKSWTKQTGRPADEAPEKWVDTCKAAHYTYMQYVRWTKTQ